MKPEQWTLGEDERSLADFLMRECRSAVLESVKGEAASGRLVVEVLKAAREGIEDVIREWRGQMRSVGEYLQRAPLVAVDRAQERIKNDSGFLRLWAECLAKAHTEPKP